MNYIELINRFWRCNMEHRLTASDTRLYFYLLHTCNQLGWKMPFGHSDRHLSALTGLSVPTVRESKGRLQQRGLLMYKAPETKSRSFDGQSTYWFPTVQNSFTDTCTDGYTGSCTVPFTEGCTVPLTNTKLNNTKLKKNSDPYNPLFENFEEIDLLGNKIKGDNSTGKPPGNSLPKKPGKRRKVAPKEEKEAGLTLPFASRQFSDIWTMLLQMPKWKGKPFQSLELTLKKLSGYEEGFAIHLMELAITNGWQGVIFQDTDVKYQKWKQNNSQHGNEKNNGQSNSAKIIAFETAQSQRNYKERF